MSLFTIEKSEKYISIRCPKNLDGAAAKEFADQTKAWLLIPVSHYFIDFTDVESIHRDFYRSIIYLRTNLKRGQKTLHSLSLSVPLLRQVREDGVEQVLDPVNSIAETFAAENSASSGAVVTNILNPFISAAQQAIEIQCKVKVKLLKPYIKKGHLDNVAIASMLALNSDDFSGNLILCFPQSCFLKIFERMFGEAHTEISADIEDGAAELLNIIYGIAKIELNKRNFNFQMAFPTVMTGDKIRIRQTGVTPAMVIPFESELGDFHIEIEFNKSQGAKRV